MTHNPEHTDTPLKPYSAICADKTDVTDVLNWVFTEKPRQVRGQKHSKFSLLLWGAATALWLVICALVYWFGAAMRDIPDTSSLWVENRTPLIVMKDRYGREIDRVGGAIAPKVPISEIPNTLSQALIATEDRRFYDHPGFDIIGLSRAFITNYKAGRVVQGGSTITQQLAKNVFLSKEQTLKRKTQELMLAVKLESRYSKAEILELYFSRVYFGGGRVGIASGAKRYFNKPVKGLGLGESAMLAGLLKAPDLYNPLKHQTLSAERTARVLAQMYKYGYINENAYRRAMNDEIRVEPFAVIRQGKAGYFTDWILQTLDQNFGPARTDLVVETTLDLNAQIAAERAVMAGVDTRRNAQQAALIAFDGTGAVKAMVGGVDYRHSSYNRAIRSKRQPGSAFKPFVYLAALEAGYSPSDILVDEPVNIAGWKPGNFSNRYHGPMRLENALALSVNTVAVKLSETVGRERVIATANRLGLSGLRPFASLALGAQETSLFDLTSAYIPFANWGYSVKPYGILSVSDTSGTLLYSHVPKAKERRIETEILGQMNRMLYRVIERGTAKKARIPGIELAGKTGTTNDYRDAWFIGFGTDIIAGVWVGNDDNTKMRRVTGGSIPAQIWHDFMQDVVQTSNPAPLFMSKAIRTQNKRLNDLLAELEAGFD